MRTLQLGKLYPITDSRNRNALSHFQLAQSFLEGGVRFFQVREKRLPHSSLDLYEQLLQIKTLCHDFRAQFVVNDRIDLALAVGADGVHLGQNDLPVQAARRLLGEKALIGISTHNADQFQQAQQYDIDYVSIGPIFHTSTKQTAHPPLGIAPLKTLVAKTKYPVVAIGGIDPERALALWEAEFASVAIVSDIVNSPDPAGRVRQYLELARQF